MYVGPMQTKPCGNQLHWLPDVMKSWKHYRSLCVKIQEVVMLREYATVLLLD